MLHLRIIAPADRTQEVTTLLRGTVGTTHLVVLEGAARDPAGDVVMCDVAREAGDDLLAGLREMGLPEHGAVAVEDIDLSLSTRAEQAEAQAPGEGVDAVLWESLTEATHEESRLTLTYLTFLTVATMLAACGVISDSAVLIVGAMVVGPEFGPLAGVCTGIVRRAPRLLWRSAVAVLVGFPVAMLLTGAFCVLMDALGLFEYADFVKPHPMTDFIWKPDPLSFVVALLAGVAGIVSLTSAKSGALVGVAISVTTVPAAANAALALSYGNLAETGGSFLQLLVNLAGIVLAGTLTLLGQKLFWAYKRRPLTVRS
ncbi:DUF389 domain-containing protein [Streptomyces albus]|uniref:DUF389 domain-containing protein n=1 Tax=Streptomyces albus TaxID=1888 RepID=A0A6C1C450_9ACTN|nr:MULTISPECIES: DUF389 domain-containing protein [Streptomyces]EPD89968.1 hypothetical protein HMPREF1486_06030 [Streptomyces sp. HPH0547]QID37613.1 DUF389 domain-containing protein [Streptomyces albus]TGG80889.1 DUF389 domain-containing protein [Streptomyces albus]UVN55443.1 DUF389 domain-containing protein [Streptomyces albus]